jgi:regulatory protein
MTSVKKSSKRLENGAETADPQDLERIAVGLLARREHSRVELARKLTARGFAATDIEALLGRLAAQRQQSDVRFTESYVRARSGRGYGPQRIRAELRERGIPAELIDQALAAATDTPRIDEIWRRKYAGCLPADYRERARQMRFLQQRGFALADIHALFGRMGAGDD